MLHRKHPLALAALTIAVLVLTSCNFPTQVSDATECVVTAPPAGRFDPFYTKYCSARGIPILGSANVPDLALKQAWIIIMNMTALRSDAVAEMLRHDVRYAVTGVNERTTDMPEYAALALTPLPTDWPEAATMSPKEYWDSRARGLGATQEIPLISGAEENLLCYGRPPDPYNGENITVHEFSHTMLDLGVALIDPSFLRAVQDAYASAIGGGKYEKTYAAENYKEYWAEGAQDFYNTNLEADPPDDVHNFVNTRAELLAYDITLHDLLAEVFPPFDWTPGCPTLSTAPLLEPAPVIPATSTAIVAEASAGRCDLFSLKSMQLVTLDWQPNTPLTFYLTMPGGVPGLEVPVAGDSQPWQYSVKWAGYSTSDCQYIPAYPGRLYCTIGLPTASAESVQELQLQLNGCALPIHSDQRAEVPAYLGEPTPTTVVCSVHANEYDCTTAGCSWDPGTYVCH